MIFIIIQLEVILIYKINIQPKIMNLFEILIKIYHLTLIQIDMQKQTWLNKIFFFKIIDSVKMKIS